MEFLPFAIPPHTDTKQRKIYIGNNDDCNMLAFHHKLVVGWKRNKRRPRRTDYSCDWKPYL